MKKSTIYLPIRNPFNHLSGELSYLDVMQLRDNIIRESISDGFNVSKLDNTILTYNGVEYINDGQSTSAAMTRKALKLINKKTIWILNEIDRSQDYTNLIKEAEMYVRAIICISDNNDAFELFGNSGIPLAINAASVPEAVKMAFYLANENETVLYSPASDTANQKENKVHRASTYQSSVNGLRFQSY